MASGGNGDDGMAKSGGDGVTLDTIYKMLQTQITGLGQEIGGLRDSMASKDQLDAIHNEIEGIHTTLNGNGQRGVITRLVALETIIQADPVHEDNPDLRSTGTLEAQNNRLKWATIKEWGNRIIKIGVLVLLLKLGYTDLAKPLLGIMPDHTPTPVAQPTSETTSK